MSCSLLIAINIGMTQASAGSTAATGLPPSASEHPGSVGDIRAQDDLDLANSVVRALAGGTG